MIKVCHIVSGDLWAGAEAMVFSLLEGLKPYPDVRLQVILLNGGRLFKKLRQGGFDATVLDESRLGTARLGRDVFRLLKATRPSIIHAHRYKENFIAFLASRGLPKAGLIATQHGLVEKYAALSSLKQRLIHAANFILMARGFHKVVVVSRQMKTVMAAKNGFVADKIAVIHNGIALPEAPIFAPAKDGLVIGSCGRLAAVKDFALMVEIARRVAARTRKIHFVIAGEGPEKNRLTDLIRHYGLADIFDLPGPMEDMGAFYKSIDVFMNTSIHEGIPMSVLEAMSHGRPVIAPQVGGLPEILKNGREGFLIPRRRLDDYVSRCITLWEDPDLRMRMGADARRRTESAFSMQTMARNYYRLYREVSSRT